MDHRTTEAPEQRTVTPAPSKPTRLLITWFGGRYFVNAPNYNGGWVVRAEIADAMERALREIASLRGGSDETDMAREIARGALAAAEGGK